MLTSIERAVLALSASRRERRESSRYRLIRAWQKLIGRAPLPPLADPRLEALRQFGVAQRTRRRQEYPVQLLDVGWTQAQMEEIIALVDDQRPASAWQLPPSQPSLPLKPLASIARAATVGLAIGAVSCSDERRTNQVSLERGPIRMQVVPPREALTFARARRSDGTIVPLLVSRLAPNEIRAVDLTELGASSSADIFQIVSSLGEARLEAAATSPARQSTYRLDDLLPVAGDGLRHVATGTNFREHAREASVDRVFNFPKFGAATPARTSVTWQPGMLLDYEVELCVRFDRDIRSTADFHAARKGFFLCGDFTDRARLMRLVNPKDVASGQGFTDAKSAADFFPTGAFLVIPRDWRSFVRAERLITRVNGDIRQDARGGEMILDFRGIVGKALKDGGGGHYTWRGRGIPLLRDATIPRGAAVMSGTAEGVIFMPPRLGDYIAGSTAWLFGGALLRGESITKATIETFITKEQEGKRYLLPGDFVEHASSSLGDIRIRVLSGSR